VEIVRLDDSEFADAIGDLATLLVEVVEDGASVGFMAGFSPDEAAAWWAATKAEVEGGRVALFVAREDGAIVGSVQLRLSPMPNQRHRADVAKLLVRPAWRRRGTARALMLALELLANDLGRNLLVLDTMQGSAAEQLYRSMGWVEVGPIPDYAAWPDGTLGPTVIYYKLV
jgi:GNAT superfamily N-acetyltransferase